MTRRPNRWRQPAFLLAAGILAFSAVGLNVAVSRLQLHFKKQPVPLARDLSTLPARLGPWVQVSHDEPLAHDVEETLGTKQYVMRYYADTRLLSPADLAEFDGKDSVQRDGLAQQLQLDRPGAVIKCDVTYYTGMVDTVAHIPERCYEASGYVPDDRQTVPLDLGPGFAGNDGGHRLDVACLNFQDSSGASRGARRVGYCFFCDGRWESDSIGVRRRLQDLRATHGFYSKVELALPGLGAEAAAARMADFLAAALPQVQACYPDWAAVERSPAGR